MPSNDRQIVFPMPISGRVRWTVSLLILVVGLLLLGAVAAAAGPTALSGAVLTLLVVLGFLGLAGEEKERQRAQRSPRERQETDGSTAELSGDDPVEVLKQRYAAGEVSDEEFDRRVERLVALGNLDDPETEPEAGTART